MANSESEGLQAYISVLTAVTKEGKVNWKAVNPTTFVWETGPPRNARVSLQRVDRMVQVVLNQPGVMVVGRPQAQRVVQQPQSSYVFQAFEAANPNPVLNIDSSNDPEVNKRLTELFEFVKTGISQKTLDFLKSLLPEQKPT